MRDSDYVLLCVSLLFLSDTYTCVKDKRCSHHIVAHNNEIILTKKSEENGAKFIKTETKNSVDDCLKSCCDLPDCTVAVFENRTSKRAETAGVAHLHSLVTDVASMERHICYMFDCKSPSVCSFMPHDNYVTLTKVIGEPKNVSHPQPPVKAHVKKPVGLGAHCDEDRVCADTYSTCSKSHVCYCSPGYIQKHGKCVKSICSKPDFVFQCDDTSRSPACVAIYDTCNGIPQCGDGSDEKNCVATLWRHSRPPAPASRLASSSLPSNQVINLKPKSPQASAKPPPPPPVHPKSLPAARHKEKILHRGRTDTRVPQTRPNHARPSNAARPKSSAELELQSRLMRPFEGRGGSRGGEDRRPLQKLIDQGIHTVHLPAEDKDGYRGRSGSAAGRSGGGSATYWTEAGNSADSARDESSPRDWSTGSDYYYDPYVRSGTGRDITDLLGDRYSAPDYSQLYQGSDTAREQAAQQQQQASTRQQYLDFWAARQHADKAENRARSPFSGPEMAKGSMFNINNDGAIKDTKTHSNDRSQDTGERRENRLPKRPKPPVRTPSAGRKESPASSPPPHRASGHKKAPVVIYASGSNSSSGSRAAAKKPQDAPIPSVVSAEYVEMLQKSYQQSKIAVVVLGLTLGVTAFALTFFICRVRHIKNRLRRGKALTSDEADYLINGMYL